MALAKHTLAEAVVLVEAHGGNVAAAAQSVGMKYGTLYQRVTQARATLSPADIAAWKQRAQPEPSVVKPITDDDLCLGVLARLRKGPATIQELAEASLVTPGRVLDAILTMRTAGQNLHEINGRWSLERTMPIGSPGQVQPYVSRSDGSYLFGFTGDSHLCSKYERLDVLGDLYRKFAAAGVDRVFHTGNWIDGEARFNKFDLLVHGMDRQIAYCAEHYPRVHGISTYAVTGDDHEGWYAQREGVDIGRMLERAMRDAGREDWFNLGYMEAYVPLQHAQSGKTAMLHCIHPGGGSAYATSYTMQKLVEGYESGNKPAVLLAGHYHKLEFINIRGVWTVQTGCAQDQTPFMRKKKIQVAIGGGIMRLTQNPETGAIEHAGVDLFIYWDRSYYQNQRWSHHGDVVLPARVA